jgi:hypothetical protein
MLMRKTMVVLALLALTGSSLHAQRLVAQDSIKSVPAPVLLDVSGLFIDRYAKVGDDMFIAGQPTEKALRELKAQGVTTVINLRMPEEVRSLPFDEP